MIVGAHKFVKSAGVTALGGTDKVGSEVRSEAPGTAI